MLHCNRNSRIAIERNPSGHHLIHGDTCRIDITLLITIATPCLLRRYIVYRSHCTGADCLRCCRLCNTKIRNLYLSFFGNDNILRFDISVYDVMIVSCLNTGTHLNCNTDRFLGRKLSFFMHIFFQSDSFYQLHDHIIESSILPYIIYIDNIRVQKPCCCLCF